MKTRRSTNIILQIHIDAVRNVVRATFASSPIETAFVAFAALAWFSYQIVNLYNAAARCRTCGAAVQAHFPVALAVFMAVLALSGLASGGRAAARLWKTATASWLVILPWPMAARRRDLRHAHAIHAGCSALAVAALTGAAAHAVRAPYQPLISVMSAAAFAAGFWLRRPDGTPPSHHIVRSEAQSAPGLSLLDHLDRLTPAYASRWAWSGQLRPIAVACTLLLIPIGGASAAVSITRHQATTAFGVALAGANLIFLTSLQPKILVSTVFRTAPLAYSRALAAVIRAPLVLSCFWFALVSAVPLAATPSSWRMLPGMAAGLLLLNALYTACAAFRPASRPQAVLLYGAGLYAVAYETASGGIPYGVVALGLVTALAAVLTRRARQDWRAHHG